MATKDSNQSADTGWSVKDSRILLMHGYSNFHKIGSGMSATVFRADKFDHSTGVKSLVAIKYIDLTDKSVNYKTKRFHREHKATLKLKHQFIVPVYEVILSRSKHRVWIVMELEKSDLLKELEKVHRVPEEKGKIWVVQMMYALKYMHSEHWAHRDMKLENILIGFDDRALLSDFGFSRVQKQSLSRTHLGSMQYSAPEVLDVRGQESSDGGLYDAFKADVWGLGIIMFVMFVGFLPVNGDTEEKIRLQHDMIHKLIDERLPPDLRMSRELSDLVKKMLTIDPAKRITLEDALKHPWIGEAADPNAFEGSLRSRMTSLVVPGSRTGTALEPKNSIFSQSAEKAATVTSVVATGAPFLPASARRASREITENLKCTTWELVFLLTITILFVACIAAVVIVFLV